MISSEEPLLKVLGDINIIIYGKKSKELKFLIFNMKSPRTLEIYDSYFKFAIGTLASSKEGMVTHEGIIPFTSLIPTKNYAQLDKKFRKGNVEEYFNHFKKVILFFFDPKNGWETIPGFIQNYSGHFMANWVNKRLIRNNSEYRAHLNTSFVGPYIYFEIVVKDKKEFKQAVSLLKNVDFANPPRQINGKIEVSTMGKF